MKLQWNLVWKPNKHIMFESRDAVLLLNRRKKWGVVECVCEENMTAKRGLTYQRSQRRHRSHVPRTLRTFGIIKKPRAHHLIVFKKPVLVPWIHRAISDLNVFTMLPSGKLISTHQTSHTWKLCSTMTSSIDFSNPLFAPTTANTACHLYHISTDVPRTIQYSKPKIIF